MVDSVKVKVTLKLNKHFLVEFISILQMDLKLE